MPSARLAPPKTRTGPLMVGHHEKQLEEEGQEPSKARTRRNLSEGDTGSHSSTLKSRLGIDCIPPRCSSTWNPDNSIKGVSFMNQKRQLLSTPKQTTSVVVRPLDIVNGSVRQRLSHQPVVKKMAIDANLAQFQQVIAYRPFAWSTPSL